MISTSIAKDDIKQWDKLPKGWSFYALKNHKDYLYCGVSARLGARMKVMWQKAEEDRLYRELTEAATVLEYQPMPDSMAALIMQKTMLMEQHPQFQYLLRPWEDYVYLALDSHRFPFVSIQSHSNDDWQYLGPFRSRFFLADLIDSVSRIVKLPACETGTYPCRKFDQEICRGWCLALAPAAETPLEQDLDKLHALLQESFVHPNNGILELVQKEREAYFNDLEFAKADLLDDEIRILQDYRDWLNFLYVAKEISFESPQIVIEHGQLARTELNGKTYRFPTDNPPYRENELLALPLAAVDEMKIIYDYIRERAHA
jgi:excinuclease UvrABC nuclease subunit